jgi:lipopolysaccharide export system permease protein
LAVLLSSLITFGNLGEHFELTAIKSLGISLIRSLIPIFVFVLFLTGGAFLVGNYLVPKAALEAYSLLYDIKQKKPALDLRQGAFYNSIPDISIKVNEKMPDGTLQGVIIYDHRGKTGNKDVIKADSGKMYTILNDQYLKLELFHGYNYTEGSGKDNDITSGQGKSSDDSYRRTEFSKSQIVFDLSSFGLNRTDKKWFQSNRIMRNMGELSKDVDSVSTVIKTEQIAIYASASKLYNYHFKNDSIQWPEDIKLLKKRRDSIALAKRVADPNTPITTTSSSANALAISKVTSESITAKDKQTSDSLYQSPYSASEISIALNQARMIKAQLIAHNTNIKSYVSERRIFDIQWHKILAQSIACIAMFLIGAPLGAIIKKGGLGVPVLMSILFFILFYVLSLMGEKWAKQGLFSVVADMWLANMILAFIGLIFLRQARLDARLFDSDFYNVLWDKLKRRFSKTA